MTDDGSDVWRDFRLATFGDPFTVWHDGPDLNRIRTRWEAAPDIVDEMLRRGLAHADPLAAESIEFLLRTGDGPREIRPALEAALPQATNTFRVRVAEVLHFMTGDQHFAEPICEVLANGSDPQARRDAAFALNGFGATTAVVEALAGAVQDPEYLLRRDAAQSLLALDRRRTTIEKQPRLWAMLKSEDARTWADAASELTRPS